MRDVRDEPPQSLTTTPFRAYNKTGSPPIPTRPSVREHWASVNEPKGAQMISFALLVFSVAVVGALLGFAGMAAGMAGVAQFVFYTFLVLFLVSLVGSLIPEPVRKAGRRWKRYDYDD